VQILYEEQGKMPKLKPKIESATIPMELSTNNNLIRDQITMATIAVEATCFATVDLNSLKKYASDLTTTH